MSFIYWVFWSSQLLKVKNGITPRSWNFYELGIQDKIYLTKFMKFIKKRMYKPKPDASTGLILYVLEFVLYLFCCVNVMFIYSSLKNVDYDMLICTQWRGLPATLLHCTCWYNHSHNLLPVWNETTKDSYQFWRRFVPTKFSLIQIVLYTLCRHSELISKILFIENIDIGTKMRVQWYFSVLYLVFFIIV